MTKQQQIIELYNDFQSKLDKLIPGNKTTIYIHDVPEEEFATGDVKEASRDETKVRYQEVGDTGCVYLFAKPKK